MSRKYQYHDEGAYGGIEAYESQWLAMIFAPEQAHTITLVKLLLYRYTTATSGLVTVGIRPVAGALPSPHLASGSFPISELTTDGDGEWKSISLSPHLQLDAADYPGGYGIVLSYPDGTGPKRVFWLSSRTKDGYDYARGYIATSSNSGASWTPDASYDFLFEEWGDPVGARHHPTIPTEPNRGKILSRMGSL